MSDHDTVKILKLVDEIGPALRRRDRAGLNDIIRHLIQFQAPMGEQWEALAQIAAHNGEHALTRAAMDQYGLARDNDAAARYQQAGMIAHLGAWDEAYRLIAALPSSIPSPATHAYSRGTAAMYVGQREDARRQLELATQLSPQSGSAWHNLSTLVDFAQEPQLADRLIANERHMSDAIPIERAAYLHALGKVHDARGDYEAAFNAFSSGAVQMQSVIAYDRDADRAGAHQAVQGYTPSLINSVAGMQSEATDRTIFVAGLPRSGTTLVEQILTSHSAVSDGAETSRLQLLASDVGGPDGAALRAFADRNGTGAAARLWHHWMDERFPGSSRVVDKTVDASRQLGLAASLLPEAPLIWVTRDPLDRAWSCFRTFFVHNIAWSYDLKDIAFHFRLEDQLLAQWQDILGNRLLVIPYEGLVSDPASWISRLLAHCGLSEEPQTFAPHENKRPVTTSSVMQVRRPINRDGIGAAAPYHAFLAPFIDAYRS